MRWGDTEALWRVTPDRSVVRCVEICRCDALTAAEPGDSYWVYSAASMPFAYLELRVRETGKALAISWTRSA